LAARFTTFSPSAYTPYCTTLSVSGRSFTNTGAYQSFAKIRRPKNNKAFDNGYSKHDFDRLFYFGKFNGSG
jgi:hypothetical protein